MLRRILTNQKLRGALRVGAFLVVANVALSAITLPQAQARVEQAIERSGLALLQQLGPSLVGPPEVATINGQRMSLASKTTPLDVKTALGRFEQYCHENSGGLAQELDALPKMHDALQRLPEALRDPSGWLTARQDGADGQSGQITCVARREAGGGLKGLLDRSLAFVDTGDLGELGDARYVVARRDASSGRTHVLAMWTEGRFEIPAMFPSEGDAPGRDSRDVPRPPASRRVLTAELAAHPYALRMYDTDQSHAQVLAFYEGQMKPKGYAQHDLPFDPESELNLNDHVRAFAKDGAAVIVVTNQTPAGQTGVTLIEMGSRGFAEATAGVEGAVR